LAISQNGYHDTRIAEISRMGIGLGPKPNTFRDIGHGRFNCNMYEQARVTVMSERQIGRPEKKLKDVLKKMTMMRKREIAVLSIQLPSKHKLILNRQRGL